MSINSALRAGVSGLVANSSALAAISDNIANVNTTAYKRNQVNFANVVTSQAVKGQYSAGGVQGITRQFVSQQGLIQASGSSTDLAISGDGFFIVADKGAGLTASDARKFTRQGSFSVDADGYLVNDSKLYLQGWPARADGTFDVSPSDLTKMNSINVKNLGAAVAPTQNIAVSANLNKVGVVSAQEAAYTATGANSMAAYADDPTGGTQPDFVIELNVIDSAGGSRKVAMAFLKDDSMNPNQWHAEIYSVPAGDVDNGGGTPGQLASGDVVFNADGTIDLASTTLFGSMGAAPRLTLAASTATGSAMAPAWSDAAGLADQTIALDLGKITQYASTSTVNAISQDGAGVGNIVAIEVDEQGVVSAIYDNSQIRVVAKVGIATFPNSDGLQPVSGNAYRPTLAAGEFTIKEAGVGGAGKISPSSLEASTVDLSAEFTGLIQTQKAYSASSKIITTADQMLEELINIKR
ncbi:flagellar hook protein FlgE [Phenylobacterium sp.]|uniref:flagellar hook protein FlgE n=1 Tax=Phenylobacterium sp. TaxID=1871053 RepID=UPI0025E033FB|nr:flagellar hook protein FlgE [Phenylobacterium sp.]MBX3486200.1 flagellar hook protein FlgE [Phenylobacterium sp.]MCW5760439.1 flagellar hook protein FlgE [Phenylobacterium sp.]